eukprot:CAMPEP_0117564282 /NCGR_PEP_ID=MMETSP0784-20121206/55947_1 /TAXON_ID=39447 /ORGANISM="" /LENGTH=258 /DNA_ID=CAMNT_0005361989 /DNA_START=54 /DNA_END=827 /DNA_ORIENTATION=+
MGDVRDFVAQAHELSRVLEGPRDIPEDFLKSLWDASESGDPSARLERAINQLVAHLESKSVPSGSGSDADRGVGFAVPMEASRVSPAVASAAKTKIKIETGTGDNIAPPPELGKSRTEKKKSKDKNRSPALRQGADTGRDVFASAIAWDAVEQPDFDQERSGAQTWKQEGAADCDVFGSALAWPNVEQSDFDQETNGAFHQHGCAFQQSGFGQELRGAVGQLQSHMWGQTEAGRAENFAPAGADVLGQEWQQQQQQQQ